MPKTFWYHSALASTSLTVGEKGWTPGLGGRSVRDTARMSESESPSYTESIHIAAPRARVWELVTAMERYGEWSSENTGGYWRKGEDGVPGTGQVGDQFVGINR